MSIQKQIAAFLALWAIAILGTSVVYGSQISVPSASGANQYLVSTTTGQYVATTTLQASKLAGSINIALIQSASATQGGIISATDYTRLYTATTTFASPLIYKGSTNQVTWSGLATTSQPSTSNLLTSDGGAGVYGTATSSATVSSPLTGAITVVGTGQTIGIQTASGSQAGAISAADWNRFNNQVSTTSVNTWTQLQTFTGGILVNNATSTITNLSVLNGTTTNATSTTFAVTSAVSALLLTNSTGGVIKYGGAAACTNQFVTALSVLGASTCSSVTDATISGQVGLAHGGTNATLSGAYQVIFMNAGNTALTTNSLFVFDPVEGDASIGTSTAGYQNLGLLTLGTSTEPQEMWSDNNPASALWAVRNSGGTLSFATSTLTATSSWNTLTLYPQGKAIIGLGVPNAISATLQLYEQSGTGQSPSFLMGGNTGGDTDYWFGRNSNNDGLDNDTLQIGGNSTVGNNIIMTMFNDTRIAFGTTTPGWSAITVSSSTKPQLTLADGVAANNAWTMRAINSNFYLATSTATATSTSAAFSISSVGNVTISNALTAGSLSLTTPLSAANGGTGATSLGPLSIVSSNVLQTCIPRSMEIIATTTAWQAGTTTRNEIVIKAFTLNSVVARTLPPSTKQFFNIQFGTGSASTTMLNASSTANTNSFTSNNTFTAGQQMFIDYGTSTAPISGFNSLSLTWLECY